MCTAVQFLGQIESGVGLPSLAEWATGHFGRMQAHRAATKNSLEGITSGIDMMTMQGKLEQKMKEAKTDEEREAIKKELEEVASKALLTVLWTTTVVDITRLVLISVSLSVTRNSLTHTQCILSCHLKVLCMRFRK